MGVNQQKGDNMVQVRKPTGKDAHVQGDGEDRQRRDFPPLREDMDSSKDRWDLIQTEMARHQDVLAELADS